MYRYIVNGRVAEPSHFDGSGSRAPKTGGSGSYGSGFDLKKVHILICEQIFIIFRFLNASF